MNQINFVKKYGIDNLFGLSIEEFNTRVELNIRHVSDLVPYEDPNYIERVERLSLELVLDDIDPERMKEFEEMCKAHDIELESAEELGF